MKYSLDIQLVVPSRQLSHKPGVVGEGQGGHTGSSQSINGIKDSEM